MVECAGGTLVARRPEGDPDCIVLSTALGIRPLFDYSLTTLFLPLFDHLFVDHLTTL